MKAISAILWVVSVSTVFALPSFEPSPQAGGNGDARNARLISNGLRENVTMAAAAASQSTSSLSTLTVTKDVTITIPPPDNSTVTVTSSPNSTTTSTSTVTASRSMTTTEATLTQVMTITSTVPCPERTETSVVDGTTRTSVVTVTSTVVESTATIVSTTTLPAPPAPPPAPTTSTKTSTATAAPPTTTTTTMTTTTGMTSALQPSLTAPDTSSAAQTTSTVMVMYAGDDGKAQAPPLPDSALSALAGPSDGESAPPLSSLTAPQDTVTTTVTIETSTFTNIISTSLVTSYLQSTTTMTAQPETDGIVHSSLSTSGPIPFATDVVASPSSTVSPITSGSSALTNSSDRAATTSSSVMLSGNVFQPLATDAPPSQIQQRGGHPVPKTGINQNGRIPTNKFYANFFLANRTQGSWTHPYSVSWAKGNGNARSWGISVSHTTRNQLVYGNGNPAANFINPVGIQSIILSASQLGSSTALTMDGLGAFSANVNLAPVAGSAPVLTFPLVQGMGFVTGVYNNSTPLIQSSVFFSNLTYGGLVSGTQTARYTVILADNTEWLIYLTPVGDSQAPTLTLTSNSAIAANRQFSGSVQVAKNPNGQTSMSIYDGSAGVYPLRGSVAGAVNNATGTYQLSWTKGGSIARTLLMFALPHHVQELAAGFSTQSRSALTLDTTTKGLARAVVGDSWTLTENNLPYDLDFAPWSPTLRSQRNLPQAAVSLLKDVSSTELAENFTAQCDLDSMYFSGKGLAKFAMMIYAANDLAGNSGAASTGLVKLKAEFDRFVSNKQINPLVYDTVWGGIVSSCTYRTGDSGCDFGNTYYNDHHFHYGYFVYTAAVIAHLDPSWLQQGTNRAWVTALVRDYANPVPTDSYFPFSRMFDWFHGHSWAHGLYETADGKDEESSSEDAFSTYALKLWGRVTGDANLEARASLMLAVTAQSLQNYFLLESNNTVQPARFVANKAAGILFENKVDHTTYFGTNIEYIEGIHMLPLNPSSTLTRTRAFVSEEWDMYFSNGRADGVAGGWRGILYANLAIVDPRTAYRFFAQQGFSNEWLDGGASRTWYLALAAGLGGAS